MREHVLVLMLAVVLAGPAAGKDTTDMKEAQEPKTELQRFQHTIQEINAYAVNAGTKLRLGAVGLDSGETDASATLARLCCASNLEKIGKQFGLMAASARGLQSCYQASGNGDAEVKLNFVRQDASTVYTAVEKFTEAEDDEAVQSAYTALARALLDLQKSAKDLTECPASD